MAHLYDTPGLSFDSGALYDAPDQPQSRNRKMAAKVKLALGFLNPDQTVDLANTIKTAMTTNAATFANPVPTMTALGTLITTASTKIAAYNTAKAAAETAMAERDAAITALAGGLTQEGAYVESVANGDPAKVVLAGMQVRAAAAPIGVPAQVPNLALTAGDFPGTVDAVWDPTRGASVYEVQISPDPMTETGWNTKVTVTKSSATVQGLTSGNKVWVRARAVGAAGPGPWSDPAVKTVP
jgi:hypothetical protein